MVIATTLLVTAGCKEKDSGEKNAEPATEGRAPGGESSEESRSEPVPEEPEEPEETPASAAVEELEFDYEELEDHIDPTSLERQVAPEVDVGLRWRDGSGEHFFVIRRLYGFEGKSINYAKLHMHLYSRPGGAEKYSRTRVLRDGEPHDRCICCETQALEHQKKSLELTDLDGDGIAELTFAYYRPGYHGARQKTIAGDRQGVERNERLGDACELVQELKLIVLEGPDKYVLRGTAKIPGVAKSGDHRPDPQPGAWPEAFLAHARQRWTRAAAAERPHPSPPSTVQEALERHPDLIELLY